MKTFDTAGLAPSRCSWIALVLALPLLMLLPAEHALALLAEPTLDQVYQTVQAGHIDQAQQMMQPVLRKHPNSPKAHYVEAELLARQGLIGKARDELGVAKRLAPSLPFAHINSVQSLRRELDSPPAASRNDTLSQFDRTPGPGSTFPWGVALAILGGGMAAWLLMRLGRPQGTPVAPMPAGFPAPTIAPAWSSPGMGLVAPPAALSAAGPSGAAASGGLGQQMASGLVTGLAVGAGVMAVEAIGHRLFSGGRPTIGTLAGGSQLPLDLAANAPLVGSALSERDFGIDSADSWNDASSMSGGWDS